MIDIEYIRDRNKKEVEAEKLAMRPLRDILDTLSNISNGGLAAFDSKYAPSFPSLPEQCPECKADIKYRNEKVAYCNNDHYITPYGTLLSCNNIAAVKYNGIEGIYLYIDGKEIKINGNTIPLKEKLEKILLLL